MAPISPKSPRRAIALLLKGALSVALIVWVARHLDAGALARQLRGVNSSLLALAAGLIVLQTAAGAMRWQAIIAAQRGVVDFFTTFRIYYIGVFFTTCTPGGILGDVVRAWHAHRTGLALPSSISSVILDRLVVVVSLVVSSLAIVPFLPPAIQAEFPIGPVSLLLLLGLLAGLIGPLAISRLPAVLQKLDIVRKLSTLSDNMLRVVLRPGSLLWILLLSVLSQAMLCVAIYIVALSVGIEVGYVDFLILMPPVLLVTILPISIGGWGVRETAMVFVLTLVGVAPEHALLLSVLVGVLAIVISLPGGILWLLVPRSEINLKFDAPTALRPIVAPPMPQPEFGPTTDN